MASFATCKLCGEKISYSPDHVHNYGMHLIEKHPELDFAHFALFYEPALKKGPCLCSCGCGCVKGACIEPTKKKMKSRNYKTSIQSWASAQTALNCPRCGKTNAPLIKRQRNKLTSSSCVSCMVLGCWPLCFLPFIISGSDLFYLYCKECGYYIGMYDRRMNDKGPPPCRVPPPGDDPQICGCR